MSVFDFFKKKKTPGNDLEAVLKPEEKPNFLSQFLPEDEDKKRALARALMMGGANMMAAGGPSKNPTNLLSVLGQGLAGGVGAYDDSRTADLEQAKIGAATRESQVKLQMAQDAAKAREGLFAGGDNGEMGYSVDQLKQYLQYQIAQGDDAGARDTLGMIQKLQQEGASKGLMVGDNGFEAAPGYNEGLGTTEKFKAGGRVAGEEAFRRTDDLRELAQINAERAAAGEAPLSTEAFLAAANKAKGTNITVGENSNKFAEESDKAAAQRIGTYIEQGGKAKSLQSNVNQFIDLARRAETGKMAELKAAIGPYASAVGVDVEGQSEIEAMDSITQNMLPSLRVPGEGAQSDVELKQKLKGLVGISKTPEGNKILAATLNGVANTQIAAADIARRATTGEISWQDAEAEIAALASPFAAYEEYMLSRGDAGGASSGITVISSEEQFNALPTGTPYRWDDEPEGSRRVKY